MQNAREIISLPYNRELPFFTILTLKVLDGVGVSVTANEPKVRGFEPGQPMDF
jgi:hypothetical protein